MEPYVLNLENEFMKIFSRFELEVTERCKDLHAIGLSVINFPELKTIKYPNPFITYFLNKNISDAPSYFSSYTKQNVDAITARTSNYFAMNILGSAEWHLKEGLSLLKAILTINSLTSISKPFKEKFNKEQNTKRTF